MSSGSFLRGILGVHNLAVIGATSFLLFATAATSQALSARLPSRRSVSLGLPVLLAGVAALEGSLFAGPAHATAVSAGTGSQAELGVVPRGFIARPLRA